MIRYKSCAVLGNYRFIMDNTYVKIEKYLFEAFKYGYERFYICLSSRFGEALFESVMSVREVYGARVTAVFESIFDFNLKIQSNRALYSNCDIVICSNEKSDFKRGYKYMIDDCDLIVGYTSRRERTYELEALEYAQNMKKKVVNLYPIDGR